MRVGFDNCRRSRFAVLAAKSNKTVTMENKSLHLLVTSYKLNCRDFYFLFIY